MNKPFFGICISLLLFLSCLGFGHCLPTNGQITVPYLSTVPNLNGAWSTPTEWNSASETKLTNQYGWTAYIRMENNGTHLFVLADFISDQSSNYADYLSVCFDTNDDGGNIFKLDDYQFTASYYYGDFGVVGRQLTYHGSGQTPASMVGIDDPSGFVLARGFSHNNDPYDNQHDHEIFEASFPLAFLTSHNTMGLYLSVCDIDTSTFLEWPVGAGGVLAYGVVTPPSPGVWGDIILAAAPTPTPTPAATQTATPTSIPTLTPTPTPTPTIPEFPIWIILPLFAGVILLSIVFIRKRIPKK